MTMPSTTKGSLFCFFSFFLKFGIGHRDSGETVSEINDDDSYSFSIRSTNNYKIIMKMKESQEKI